MPAHTPSHLAVIVTTLLIVLPTSADARIECWTNRDGITECANVVPPEYAQEEVRTLDRRGMTTEVRPRAPTPEEAEAARLRQAEEAKSAAYDRMLLATYLSEEDIIRTRDRMTGTIDASIEINRGNIEGLQQRLATERRRAADHERQGRPVPAQITREISGLENLIHEREEYIRGREKDRAEMLERFERERQRFVELQRARR